MKTLSDCEETLRDVDFLAKKDAEPGFYPGWKRKAKAEPEPVLYADWKREAEAEAYHGPSWKKEKREAEAKAAPQSGTHPFKYWKDKTKREAEAEAAPQGANPFKYWKDKVKRIAQIKPFYYWK